MTEDLFVDAEQSPKDIVDRAFGEKNRARLLGDYFADISAVPPSQAWKHIYQLLLWIDRTTRLAHCYESDKCQPGRPWYARSLTFHDWLSRQMDVRPADLGEHIDWLFSKASNDLAEAASRTHYSGNVQRQRAPYEGRGFPEPGEDPELEQIILQMLGSWLESEPPPNVLRELTNRVQAHLAKENKRKNLVGEGFEDTLKAVLEHVPSLAQQYDIRTRALLHDLPGFYTPPSGAKPREVDLALIRYSDQRRILVTAKWSIRADREEQFGTDFNDYARYEALGQNFDYVLITNEFDAARLANACERRRENAFLFTDVVHVNPQGPLVTYGEDSKGKNVPRMRKHIQEGRIASIEDWLVKLGVTA